MTLTLHLVIHLLGTIGTFAWIYSSPPSRNYPTRLVDSSFTGETQGGLIDINSRALGHLHGSKAFVNGSARCTAVLTHCSFTFGSSNASYIQRRQIQLVNFLHASKFRTITSMHDLDSWCIVLLTDQINRSIWDSLAQLLHGQSFTENPRIQTNHLSLACATRNRFASLCAPSSNRTPSLHWFQPSRMDWLLLPAALLVYCFHHGYHLPWILFELLVYEVHYSPNVQLTNLSSIYPHVLALFGLEVHPLKLLHRSSTYRSPRFCSTPCWWLPSNLGGCANLSCQREGGFQYKLNFYLEGLVHGMISSKILRPYPKLLNEMSYCFFDSSVAITGIEKTCSG